MPELLLCVGTRLLNVRHAINKVAPAKNWDEQIGIFGLCRNLSLLLRLKIDNHVRFAGCMIDFVNRVGNESAALLMKSAYLQQARARSFRWLIGKFDSIPPLLTLRPYRAELINTAERRVWPTGGQLRPHAPDVDLRSALFHLRDREFIQIARANNFRV